MNSGTWFESLDFVITQAEAGERLDRVLTERLEDRSRSLVQSWVKAGFVTLDSQRVTKLGLPVTLGVRVELQVPRSISSPPEVEEYRPHILFRDDALVVIDKPAGQAAHRNRNCQSGTVADWAVETFGELPRLQGQDRPGIVHRLDRETSGVMVLALCEPAMISLRAQFKARTVRKQYRALVHGVPTFESEWIDAPIGRDPSRPDRMSVSAPAGREAQTLYETLERFHGAAHVRCRPRTGRTHQIRVHMMSHGFPLIGDKVYKTRSSGGVAWPADAPLVERQFLHAHTLAFDHPMSGDPLEFTAPLPDDIRAFRDWLRAHRPALEER